MSTPEPAPTPAGIVSTDVTPPVTHIREITIPKSAVLSVLTALDPKAPVGVFAQSISPIQINPTTGAWTFKIVYQPSTS